MDSGEISAIVAIAGMVLSALHITGIDASVISGAVNGVISIAAIGAALWSWWTHRQKAGVIAGAIRSGAIRR